MHNDLWKCPQLFASEFRRGKCHHPSSWRVPGYYKTSEMRVFTSVLAAVTKRQHLLFRKTAVQTAALPADKCQCTTYQDSLPILLQMQFIMTVQFTFRGRIDLN
jgi:hypothetical protein